MKKRVLKVFSKKDGFTLIELLIVITIIIILAALLFPSLQYAIEKARQITCLSNMKQIAIGMLLYVEDWDGYFPDSSDRLARWGGPPRPDVGLDNVYPPWSMRLWENNYVKASMFACPNYKRPQVFYSGHDLWAPRELHVGPRDYAINQSLVNRKYNTLKHPYRVIMLFESYREDITDRFCAHVYKGTWRTTYDGTSLMEIKYATFGTHAAPHVRQGYFYHYSQGYTNFAYCDGHVEAILDKTLPPQKKTAGGGEYPEFTKWINEAFLGQ